MRMVVRRVSVFMDLFGESVSEAGGILHFFQELGQELAALADAAFGDAEEFGIDGVLLVRPELGDGEGDGVGALHQEIVPDQAFEVGAEGGVAEGFGAGFAGFGEVGRELDSDGSGMGHIG